MSEGAGWRAGVDKRSVDTWMHPHIFHMQYSTGAPPDMFDAGGQNWGFPTYNWEEMAKDGYEWWRRRLTTLSQCVQALFLLLQACGVIDFGKTSALYCLAVKPLVIVFQHYPRPAWLIGDQVLKIALLGSPMLMC